VIFGQDRQELRQMYINAWQKSLSGHVMSPLEAQIAAVIAEHPEYQASLRPDELDSDYTPERGQSNPFLHMGLHLAIREQVATDRPTGIAAIHRKLSRKTGDPHQAEHRMIDCLSESLWEAQSRNQPPDERQYIERLQRLDI
jgi:Domain of unknown function (DUF1841)